uniref:Uncharacterized protein n=1 Tax=Anguilla anguilla TaxID=7936 RepID=A0A0E9WMH2_ANGAN
MCYLCRSRDARFIFYFVSKEHTLARFSKSLIFMTLNSSSFRQHRNYLLSSECSFLPDQEKSLSAPVYRSLCKPAPKWCHAHRFIKASTRLTLRPSTTAQTAC